jgi:hypothetical protein
MKLNSLGDVIPFLNFLDKRGLHYDLRHTIDDAITVEAYLVGVRVEIYFYSDRVEFSTFEGDESVKDDQSKLFGLLEG